MGYVEGSLQKRSGAHSEEVPKEHGEGGQRLLYKGANEERLGLVDESNLQFSHHIASIRMICSNTISFERGPRSERGPGSARARLKGSKLKLFTRARADPGPHSPQGPLSRENLL